MNLTRMLTIAAVAAFTAGSALAQGTQTAPATENNGHHYSGGPKTEVPHHMGAKDVGAGTSSVKRKGSSGSHHYSGGPNTGVPHQTGAK